MQETKYAWYCEKCKKWFTKGLKPEIHEANAHGVED